MKDKAVYKCVGERAITKNVVGEFHAWGGRERERTWVFGMSLRKSTVIAKPFRIKEFSQKRKRKRGLKKSVYQLFGTQN